MPTFGFLDIIKQLSDEDATFAVTKDGVSAGVLMTAERFEALLETIGILADTRIVQSLARSRRDFRVRQVGSHFDVWEDG